MRWSWKVGTYAGISVYIHATFRKMDALRSQSLPFSEGPGVVFAADGEITCNKASGYKDGSRSSNVFLGKLLSNLDLEKRYSSLLNRGMDIENWSFQGFEHFLVT